MGRPLLTLTYRTTAEVTDAEILCRSDEAKIRVEDGTTTWALDADGATFRLVPEALRLRLAYLFDPYLAVNTSNLEPHPHQITAV